MAKEKFVSLTFTMDDLIIMRDAMGAWVALLTEDYQSKPDLETAKKMDAAVSLNDRLRGRKR